MYIQGASIEDITDVVRLFRDEAYPYWETKHIPYNHTTIESTLRMRFHEDTFYIAKDAGKTRGLLWVTQIKFSGHNKMSLYPISFILDKKYVSGDTKRQMFIVSRRQAMKDGLMQRALNALEGNIYSPYYNGPGFTELQGEKKNAPWVREPRKY